MRLAIGAGGRVAPVELRLIGARPGAAVPANRQEGVVNDFSGRERSSWRTGLPT